MLDAIQLDSKGRPMGADTNVEQVTGNVPGGPGSPSLDYYRESVLGPEAEKGALTRCPRKLGWVMFCPETGQVRPARCGANLCPFCCTQNARLVAGAITLAKPERMVTLTQIGSTWQETRWRVRKMNFLIRKAGIEFNFAWHAEINPRATGRHAHGWQWGEYIRQAKLQAFCEKAGMGIPWIAKVRAKPGTKLDYGVKLAGLGYGMKAAEQEEAAAGFLEANGGRLVHASRGFWRDENGQKFAGQREAMKAWARSGSDETWELVREDQLPAAMAMRS